MPGPSRGVKLCDCLICNLWAGFEKKKLILFAWELTLDIWGQYITVSATMRTEKEEKNNYEEILSAFPLFPGGKMLLRSEGERQKFYFPEKKQ